MKKIIVCLLIFVSLFFISTKEASALCQGKALIGGGCPSSYTLCGDGQNCCSNPQTECSQYPSSPANTSGNNSGSNNSSADVHGKCGDTKIDTAIGCVPVLSSSNDFASFVLRWAIGVGGGIAFLLILYGGFMVMSSQGNPERLKAGQELLTSAISGIVLLIFSVFILNFIGINILGIFN